MSNIYLGSSIIANIDICINNTDFRMVYSLIPRYTLSLYWDHEGKKQKVFVTHSFLDKVTYGITLSFQSFSENDCDN